MTPEQHKQFLESNERATAEAIQKFVNGKIDKLNQSFVAHLEEDRKFQEEIKPFIQAKAGLGVLFKWLLILSAGFVAWAQIKAGLK